MTGKENEVNGKFQRFGSLSIKPMAICLATVVLNKSEVFSKTALILLY